MKAVDAEGFGIRKFWHRIDAALELGATCGPTFGEAYSDLNFEDVDNAPTEAEVDAKLTELNNGEALRCLRIVRDRLLAETDWWAAGDRTITTEQTAYRQSLRDLPSDYPNVGFDTTDELLFTNVTFPTKP